MLTRICTNNLRTLQTCSTVILLFSVPSINTLPLSDCTDFFFLLSKNEVYLENLENLTLQYHRLSLSFYFVLYPTLFFYKTVIIIAFIHKSLSTTLCFKQTRISSSNVKMLNSDFCLVFMFIWNGIKMYI